MQESKYASILSPKFSTQILHGPNFFKPSVPGLRIIRAFASLFGHFWACFAPPLSQKRSFVSITFEKVAQDVICSVVDLRWMSIFWVFGPFLHLISAKMYILSQSLLLRVAVSFGGLCSATDLRWD